MKPNIFFSTRNIILQIKIILGLYINMPFQIYRTLAPCLWGARWCSWL